MLMLLLIFAAGLWAGLQNALAGGGSFVTLPALIMSGMSPLAANITSTVALFPGQVTSGLAGRSLVTGAGRLPFKALFGISVVGGALGGLLLLNTPSSIFSRLVPWLVLFATAMFAWGSFRRKPANLAAAQMGPVPTGIAQFFIAIYGGYFGGGIGFLMMAALSMAGVTARHAAATKNVLASVMNAAAVALFVTSPLVHWPQAIALGAGAILGGLAGVWALRRVNERWRSLLRRRDDRALDHPVVAQHDEREQQLGQAARRARAARQQWCGFGVQHHEVGLAAGLQVADDALQIQRARRARRVQPPQVFGRAWAAGRCW